MARPGMLGLSAVRVHDGALRSFETLRASRTSASKPQGRWEIAAFRIQLHFRQSTGARAATHKREHSNLLAS